MKKAKTKRQEFHRWFWKVLQKPFPIWYCTHWLARLHREFNKDRAQAATQDEIERLWSQERFEAQEFYGEREGIRTRRLLAKARKIYVSLADIPFPTGLENHWETGDFGHRYLSERSYSALYRLIWQTQKEHWDFWLKIVAALTGLVGASIGLLAFLHSSPR